MIIYENRDGHFIKQTIITFADLWSSAFDIWDINSDHLPDILIYDRILLNTGNGIDFTNYPLSIPMRTIKGADINHDGRFDIAGSIHRITYNEQLTTYLNKDLEFFQISVGSEEDYNWDTFEFCDLNEDGFKDLVMRVFPEQAKIFYNTGSGVYDTTYTYINKDRSYTRFINFGDLNNDGVYEIIIADSPEIHVFFRQNNIYQDPWMRVGQLNKRTWCNLVFDPNMDGFLDIAIGYDWKNEYEKPEIWYNSGNGDFPGPAYQFNPLMETYRMDFGDLNNDYRPDIVFSGYRETDSVYIYYNTESLIDSLPIPPTSFSINNNTDLVEISFDPGNDDVTPVNALRYNFRFSRNDTFINTGIVYGDNSKYLQKPSLILQNLKVGSYKINFQTVDQNKNLSNWSNDVVFNITEPDTTPPDSVIITKLETFEPEGLLLKTNSGGTAALIDWQIPKSSDYEGVRIVRSTTLPIKDPFSGKMVYEGGVKPFIDYGISPDTLYYYSIFAYDENHNYSKFCNSCYGFLTPTLNAPPTITHQIIGFAKEGLSITIRSQIYDDIEIIEKQVNYITPLGEMKSVELSKWYGNIFHAIIPQQDVTNGILKYQIYVSDGANITTYPSISYQKIKVLPDTNSTHNILTGRVWDVFTMEPVPNITLMLKGNNKYYTTQSDLNGLYHFLAENGSTYRLVAFASDNKYYGYVREGTWPPPRYQVDYENVLIENNNKIIDIPFLPYWEESEFGDDILTIYNNKTSGTLFHHGRWRSTDLPIPVYLNRQGILTDSILTWIIQGIVDWENITEINLFREVFTPPDTGIVVHTGFEYFGNTGSSSATNQFGDFRFDTNINLGGSAPNDSNYIVHVSRHEFGHSLVFGHDPYWMVNSETENARNCSERVLKILFRMQFSEDTNGQYPLIVFYVNPPDKRTNQDQIDIYSNATYLTTPLNVIRELNKRYYLKSFSENNDPDPSNYNTENIFIINNRTFTDTTKLTMIEGDKTSNTYFGSLFISDTVLTKDIPGVIKVLDGDTLLVLNSKGIIKNQIYINSTPTDINPIPTKIPKEFILNQNYPNPFNPFTNIKFGLPTDSNVLIELFNITGQFITTIMDEKKTAGYHTIKLNASYLASGIYIYKFKAGQFVQSRKMVLLR